MRGIRGRIKRRERNGRDEVNESINGVKVNGKEEEED